MVTMGIKYIALAAGLAAQINGQNLGEHLAPGLASKGAQEILFSFLFGLTGRSGAVFLS